MNALPQNTTDRLLAVAEAVEAEGRWNQSTWGYLDSDPGNPSPYEWGEEVFEMTGKFDCGTPACFAGWAVRFTPPGQLPRGYRRDWVSAGLYTLGLDSSLAFIFSTTFRPKEPGTLLRILATLPASERTVQRLYDEVAAKDLLEETGFTRMTATLRAHLHLPLDFT